VPTETPEKRQVLQAIRDLGRRVTVADVATKTGLPLHVVTSQLNAVAAETGGHLEVGTAGDIAYGFAPGFQSVYLAQGIQRTLQLIWEKTFQIGYYLLRISFGIMLILSVLLVIALILVVILGRGRDGDRDGDRGFDLSFFDYMILRDLFWWGVYSTYPEDTYYGRSTRRRKSNGNFLLNCFSFLFGDGNPNAHLEEKQWQLIAQAIKGHNGVITAEQLAPYTGSDPKNEDGVLPVLVRFDGRPEVTETGNIVYTFPSLQVSAAEAHGYQLPVFLEEWPWKFTEAPADSLVPVYILAGVNFFGSWWLFFHAAAVLLLTGLFPLILLLVTYGTLFVGIPLVRWLVLQWLNGRIESRNQRRQSYARLLDTPSADLRLKLEEAQAYKVKEQLIEQEKIVYTTEKDALEQEFDNPR